jgi:hypothetical protein
MGDGINLIDKYEQSVLKKRDHVERTVLPKLRDAIIAFKTYFESIFNILKRKSLIRDDPYKDDEKISEVLPPSSEPFMDSERDEQLSRRMSNFHSQLDFLSNYYQLSLEFLDLKRVKGIVDLFKYVNWTNFTPTSTNQETRFLAELVQKVKMGSDNISIQILSDATGQLERNVKQIFTCLDEIIFILKEMYKLDTRKNLIPNLSRNMRALVSSPQEAIKDKELKVLFAKNMPAKPYFPELLREVFEEDFTQNGEALKNTMLQRLEVKEDQKKKAKKQTDYKVIALQGIRVLASAGFQMEDAVSKLNDNHSAYISRKMGIGERIYRWFRNLVVGKNKTQSYDIEYFDVTSSTTRSERVDFNEVIEEVQKRAKLFTSLTNRASSQYHRLETAPEDHLYSFLTKNIASLIIIHRRLAGLNDFFKSEMSRERKGKLRGINLELNVMRNSIVKANKRKHEYNAAKEEIRQMKRLGIKIEEM